MLTYTGTVSLSGINKTASQISCMMFKNNLQ